MATRNLDSFIRSLNTGVKRTFSKKTMRLAAELAILQIVHRTRILGKGVSRTGGKDRRLKALKPSTIEARRRLKHRGQLHPKTSPGKSNLTRSGRLLDSLVIKELTNTSVTWGPKNNRRRGEKITNEQLGELVAQAGRPFNFLSSKDIKKLVDLVDEVLQKQMRQL